MLKQESDFKKYPKSQLAKQETLSKEDQLFGKFLGEVGKDIYAVSK